MHDSCTLGKEFWMLKKIIALTSIISSIHLPLYSVLVSAETLKNNNQLLYLFYDVHEMPASKNEEDQLAGLSNYLKEREIRSDSPMSVIIEQPLEIIKQFDSNPRVTSGLQQNIESKHLKLTHIIPSEIRCASLAALYILSAKTNPMYINPKLHFSLGKRDYCLELLSLKDLKDEFNVYKTETFSFLDTIENTGIAIKQLYDYQKTLFEENIKLFDKSYAELEDLQPLLTYAQKINSDKRSNLWIATSQLFEHLFNLYLFKMIYERLKPNSETMLVSGYLHSLKISQLLRQIGFEQLKYHSKGYCPYDTEILPLEQEQLNIFKENSYSWCTVL